MYWNLHNRVKKCIPQHVGKRTPTTGFIVK